MAVGVLALQGAITPHCEMLHRLGVEAVRVTTPEHFEQIDRLILPGGESTTMLKLLDKTGLWAPLEKFVFQKPAWGTCAGAILLAQEVHHPSQRSLKRINIAAERNAYGSQRESFKTTLEVKGLEHPLEVDFIRAPKLSPLSSDIEVLSRHNGETVLMQKGNILVSSFHVELGTDASLHRYFLSL